MVFFARRFFFFPAQVKLHDVSRAALQSCRNPYTTQGNDIGTERVKTQDDGISLERVNTMAANVIL